MTVRPQDLASTLVARRRSEFCRWEAEAERRHRAVRDAVRTLFQDGAIRRAWLIGSLAWGRPGAGSDVDLVVEGLDAMSQARAWAELQSSLRTPVDLLRLEDLPAAFRARVLEEGELVDAA
jgi:predicted nucleotidyltransferase